MGFFTNTYLNAENKLNNFMGNNMANYEFLGKISNIMGTMRDAWQAGEVPVLWLGEQDEEFFTNFLQFLDSISATETLLYSPLPGEKYPEDVNALNARINKMLKGGAYESYLFFDCSANRKADWEDDLESLAKKHSKKHLGIICVSGGGANEQTK